MPEASAEVAVPEPEPEVTEAEAPKPKYDPDWTHERIEYLGDDLAVRVPTMNALTVYQLASSKYVDPDKLANVTGMFVDRHLGPDSYDRVAERMMDPDEPHYTTKSVAEIMGLLVKKRIELEKAERAEAIDASPSRNGTG